MTDVGRTTEWVRVCCLHEWEKTKQPSEDGMRIQCWIITGPMFYKITKLGYNTR